MVKFIDTELELDDSDNSNSDWLNSNNFDGFYLIGILYTKHLSFDVFFFAQEIFAVSYILRERGQKLKTNKKSGS